jgi:glycosyltransferase involved in cell wall biosynthesis
MNTILIDCRFAGLHAGLGRYLRELVTHLLQRPAELRYVLIVRDKKEEWIPDGALTVEADIPHYSLAEQTVLPRIIRNACADLLFSPHFNVPLFCPVPFVITVHDLILHRYPNRASWIKQIVYRSIIGHAVHKAHSIIAVSNFTAQELSETYGSSIAAKTQVIHEGVNEIYRPVPPSATHDVLKRHNIHRPYFLYVGNAKQHKNVPLLLEAFQKAQLNDVDLLLVSGGEEARALVLPANVRILSSVSDADLPALYSAAKAFVTGSLYEGYCLPVAEALACGCPVIASNRSAIPETAAGRAMLVEPTVEAFTDALRHSPSLEKPFITGKWARVAEETEALLLRTLAALERQQ